MRFRVMQTDYPEDHPEGVDLCILETDDGRHANCEAQAHSVPGNPCWVQDTAPIVMRVR